ncbi:hypothetical protein [Sorangium sp. So ce131]|uniref:hypothetical protein n=1 Tax=Sorangium sp. So ce131 TaxID=3133282 RepID=UPI003F5F71F3
MSKRNDQVRSDFVRKRLDDYAKQYPGYNVVMCHTKHKAYGKYVHRHEECPIELAIVGKGSIGFEIYLARKGDCFKLVRKGDGGWINWGYLGDFDRLPNEKGNILIARTKQSCQFPREPTPRSDQTRPRVPTRPGPRFR